MAFDIMEMKIDCICETIILFPLGQPTANSQQQSEAIFKTEMNMDEKTKKTIRIENDESIPSNRISHTIVIHLMSIFQMALSLNNTVACSNGQRLIHDGFQSIWNVLITKTT